MTPGVDLLAAQRGLLPFPSVRRFCLATLICCLAAALPALGVRLVATVSARQPVYSMAALTAALDHDPATWLHRTVRVRALLGGACTEITGLYNAQCGSWELALTDPDPNSDVTPLPLAWGKAPALLAFLRRLPLVRQLVPSPQLLHSSVPAVYRIQLQPTACVLSANPPCYRALLLDAIPPNNSTDWVQIGS